MQTQYDSKMSSKPKFYGSKPTAKLIVCGVLFAILGFPALFFFLDYTVMVAAISSSVIWAIAAVFIIVYVVKRVNYNKSYDYYLSQKWDWEKTAEKEAQELLKRAAALVDG